MKRNIKLYIQDILEAMEAIERLMQPGEFLQALQT